MKNRFFLLSVLAAAAVMPGSASANLVLDMPPILAGNGVQNTCSAKADCTDSSYGQYCCSGKCTNDACPESCSSDANCASSEYGAYCCNNLCTNVACPACTQDSDCSSGQKCCNNQCITGTECPTAGKGTLNDTGITTKQANYDDSQFGRDAATLTKTGSGHAGFDFSNVSGCIRDNTTGLLWSPDQGSVMSYSGAESKATTANTNSLCGKSSGWRVPNVRELLSLVSYGAAAYSEGKTIDSTFFSDTKTDAWYWTATTGSGTDKWGVGFITSGLSLTNTLNANSYLRLVNGTELKGSFIPANSTVTDENAKLTWKRCLEGQTWSGTACTGTATPYTWANALSLTANSWRLPNIKELQSSTEYFAPDGSNGYIWSASPYAGDPTNKIWVLSASNGTFANNILKSYDGYVRLVQDAQ